ncbi:bifunctional DNA primase/helicase [Westiellopsis prolifica IICB1]|nr:bifunctional DNA primase/helicase [Westiellopsis prolifica IICB1]
MPQSQQFNNSLQQQQPSYIEAKHWNEWLASAVDPTLTALNVRSLTGNEAYEYLLYALPQTARRNDGRLRDKYLRQYAHVSSGGWWVSGLDPLNNWRPMEWGRFKPDNPRIDWEKGKFVKYESPPKTPNRVTYFNVPDCIWDKVAKRYNIKRYHSPLALRLCDRLDPLKFWQWVQQHPEIPVIPCEGEKKAASLLTLGFVAIALPGIWNGRIGKKDFDERLHPDLMPLAQPGRKFITLFDYETQPKTRWSVYQAIVRTGKTILAAGCSSEVALLPGPEKGVDDFVVERGENADALLTAIIDDAKTLSDYQRSYRQSCRGLTKKYTPHVRVNVKYLSEAVELPQSGLVGLCSDMGTGKTELMKKWRDEHPDQRFLNNGHRVNLLKNLAQRLQTEMYSDLGYVGLAKATALSITIDSLHKLNTDALKYGCIFIDEVCQYLTHLLHSKTCKEHRAEILEVLQYIVYNTPLVVIADAHLDDVTIDFFRAMRPPGEEPFIIKNDWKNGGRTIYWYEGNDTSALVAQVSAALMAGQKIMVASDSKKFIKKLEYSLTNRGVKCREVEAQGAFGAGDAEGAGGAGGAGGEKRASSHMQTGEQQMQRELGEKNTDEGAEGVCGELSQKLSSSSATPASPAPPATPATPAPLPPCPSARLRIWSIHSENSGSEENVAFIKDITNAVKSLDALFVSPSLGTGVDIPEYHFDAVFGAFHGVSQTATECAQQLWRYRPIVPIHVWVAPRPPFGYLDTNASKIKERLLQTNEMTAFLLRIDRETGKRGAEKDWALDAYCQIMANRHQSINNLRADLRDLLTEMGNQIIPMGTDDNDDAVYELKNAAAALDIAYYEAVASAKNISAIEYRTRKSKDYLKPTEVFECEKFRLFDAYGMEVTRELVKKDDGGRFIRAISSLEAILSEPEGIIVDPHTGRQYPAPPTIVADKDYNERNKLPLCMDWGNFSARWLARFSLGLHGILKRLVNGEEITAADPECVQMTEIAKQCAAHVKAILGFTVPPDCKPIWLLGLLLDQLGLKLSDHKKGPRGQQVKYFSLSQEELDFALAVIAHRERKRTQKEERVRSTKNENAAMQAMYGVSPPNAPVSTPPHNCIGEPHLEGVNTTDSELGKSPIPNIDFEQFEPSDGNPTPIKACVEQLTEGIKYGVQAIKSILQRWTTERRWCAVLLLEKIAESELRRLEELAPQIYEWLNESILPMEGATN